MRHIWHIKLALTPAALNAYEESQALCGAFPDLCDEMLEFSVEYSLE